MDAPNDLVKHMHHKQPILLHGVHVGNSNPKSSKKSKQNNFPNEIISNSTAILTLYPISAKDPFCGGRKGTVNKWFKSWFGVTWRTHGHTRDSDWSTIHACGIWKQRLHPEEASNVFCVGGIYERNNHPSFWIFGGNSVKEISWLSWRHLFRKIPISKCFPSTRK